MKKPISYFFILLAIVTTSFSLLGYLARFNIMYFEFLVNFRLQYLLLALVLLFYFALTRRFWLVVSLFCVLINLVEIVPWYFSANATKIKSEPEMRLLLFNVLDENKQYAETISFVKLERPTIAVFLETDSRWLRQWPQQLLALQEILPYHFSARELQIEIYSAVPLENPAIKLYGVNRGLVTSKIAIDGREILFIAAHAYSQYYFGQEGFELRNQQLNYIGNYSKRDRPVALVGDLNVTMWSPYYKRMMERSGLHDARDGFGILPTQSNLSPNTPWLAIPIDYCLVSSDFRVKNIRTGPYLGSDHLPLISDLVFAD